MLSYWLLDKHCNLCNDAIDSSLQSKAQHEPRASLVFIQMSRQASTEIRVKCMLLLVKMMLQEQCVFNFGICTHRRVNVV